MQTYNSQTLNRVADGLYRTGKGIYFARFRAHGKNFKTSLKTHDRKIADRKLKEFISKVQAEHGLKPDMTLSEVTEKWLASLYTLKPRSLERRKGNTKTFLPVLGEKLMRDISRADIEAWASKRANQIAEGRGRKISARTFNADRLALSMVMDFAKNTLEIISTNPVLTAVKKQKASKAVVVPPTQEQFVDLMEYIDQSSSKHGAAFLKFLAYSGVRADEARNILWRQVDFDREQILITGGKDGTKNHRQRNLPMFEPLKALLVELAKQEHKPTDKIFPINTAIRLMMAASAEIGLPEKEHFTQHDMRHFFCSNCIEAGVDFATIANWLGHSDGGKLVAGTYGHLRAVHSAAMAKLVTFSL